MAVYRTSISFKAIVLLVLGLAFGFGVIAVVYQGAQNSNDVRSRAAEETVDYKRWDFNSSLEGWSGQNLSGLSVSQGMLFATIGSGTGAVQNNAVGTSVPSGNKYIALRMAVVPATARVLGDQTQGSVAATTPVNFGTISGPTPTCVPKPTCAPGTKCIQPLYYPQGGWCPSPTPVPPNPCVPKPTCAPGKMCIQPLFYPRGGWCPPVQVIYLFHILLAARRGSDPTIQSYTFSSDRES